MKDDLKSESKQDQHTVNLSFASPSRNGSLHGPGAGFSDNRSLLSEAFKDQKKLKNEMWMGLFGFYLRNLMKNVKETNQSQINRASTVTFFA